MKFIPIFAALFALAPAANADVDSFWSQVSKVTQACVVHHYSQVHGTIRDDGFKSRCDSFELGSNWAHAIVGGRVVRFYLTQSENSDGGDLDHVFATDTSGRPLANRYNVLAFDQIAIALAGSEALIPSETHPSDE